MSTVLKRDFMAVKAGNERPPSLRRSPSRRPPASSRSFRPLLSYAPARSAQLLRGSGEDKTLTRSRRLPGERCPAAGALGRPLQASVRRAPRPPEERLCACRERLWFPTLCRLQLARAGGLIHTMMQRKKTSGTLRKELWAVSFRDVEWLS